jgi:SNF2 family DNA or RNA helicase
VLPHSKKLGDHEVLVKWGLEEAQVLNNMDIRAPSPIERQYNWPGKYTPFDHQKKTAAFLTLYRRCFCFNEQGSGKSSAAIWAADYLMSLGLVSRVLILCPLSIMDAVWRNELFTNAMHRTVGVAHGTAQKRKNVLAQNDDFVIINYDGIGVVHDELKAGGFDLVIVDEATCMKNPKTKRWKLLNGLLDSNTRLWLMTGTPAAQSPMDAYGLAKLVSPNSVPKFIGTFRDRVMHQVTRFKWVPREDASTIVHDVLQPAIRFTKEQCMDLPDMVYTRRSADMTRQQKKYYEELRKEMLIQAAGEDVTAANAAVQMIKLLQIAAGAVYSDDKEVLEFDIKHRYNALREVIDESNHKLIIFAPFRHVIRMLSEQLTADGFTTEIIDGTVPAGRRSEIFDAFQTQKDPRILIIQPQAAAHGVTLTAADTIIWWGPVSSLETYAQANARIHRAGQTNKCTVVQLYGSPVEERVYKMLDGKIDVHSQIVDLYKEVLA